MDGKVRVSIFLSDRLHTKAHELVIKRRLSLSTLIASLLARECGVKEDPPEAYRGLKGRKRAAA